MADSAMTTGVSVIKLRDCAGQGRRHLEPRTAASDSVEVVPKALGGAGADAHGCPCPGVVTVLSLSLLEQP